MNDLENTRNHARDMAALGAHTRECPVKVAHDSYLDQRIDLRVVQCAASVDHEGHAWMEPDRYGRDASWQRWCHGACSGCVSDAERALWTQIADEMDAYMSRGDEGQGTLT